jgi:hypothetical protein
MKLAPVIRKFQERGQCRVLVVNSGQHRSAVRLMLMDFGVAANVVLPALPHVPNLGSAVRHVRTSVRGALRREHPAAVIVQGDTLTAYAGARAAVDLGLRLAHVEAGLRTPHAGDPFPEEWFRRRIARHAHWHFAPSRSAVQHLLAEGVASEAIHCVGNTGIDTLRDLLERSGHEVVAEARDGAEIEIWGDGEQTRSFLYIDECVEGVRRLMNSDFTGPVNIGSEEMVTINHLAAQVTAISGKRISVRHIDGPLGVRGRNSDNRLIWSKLRWKPSQPLRIGLEKTYRWIDQQVGMRMQTAQVASVS